MMRLVSCEMRKLLHSRALLALVAATLILTSLTITSPASSPGGPMFMMAGPAPTQIGGAIGFIGNMIDPHQVAASAIRTSFVYTLLWMVVVILFATSVFAADFTSGSVRVSQAKGIRPSSLLGAKALVTLVSAALCYSASCFASFLFKANQYGTTIAPADLGLFFGVLGANVALLCALAAQAMLLFALTRSTIASALGLLVLQVFVLLGYSSAYSSVGSEAADNVLFAASPMFYLLHTCSLSFSNVPLLLGAGFGIAATVLSLMAAAVALRVREA